MAATCLFIALACSLVGIGHANPGPYNHFLVSAGTLDNGKTASITIDGTAYLNSDAADNHRIVAPDGTLVRLVAGNVTEEKVTPLDIDVSGALIVATPGCGATPRKVGVFYFPDNTATSSGCGGGPALESFVKSLPKGAPVAMTTLYNQRGWAAFKCPDDARSFDATVQLLGGSYTGSLGPRTADSWDAYKSAYVLIGSAQGAAAFEKFCHDFGDDGSAPKCMSGNGDYIENVSAAVPACPGPSVLV